MSEIYSRQSDLNGRPTVYETVSDHSDLEGSDPAVGARGREESDRAWAEEVADELLAGVVFNVGMTERCGGGSPEDVRARIAEALHVERRATLLLSCVVDTIAAAYDEHANDVEHTPLARAVRDVLDAIANGTFLDPEGDES